MSLKTLRKSYQEGRLLPFIGAGVSASVCWTENEAERHGPSWQELVNQAAEQLGFNIPDLLRMRGTDLQILEYFRRKNGGSISGLTNWMVQHMRPPDADLLASPIHVELAQLTECRTIYTTNYDDFLERSLRLHGRQAKRVAVEEHMGVPSKDIEVVKFHGDWDHPEAMVLSESDYEDRLKMATAMDYRFRSDLLGRAVLFVGYSFRDPNVSYLFRVFTEQFKTVPTGLSKRRAYIVVPNPSDFESQLFETRDIEVLPVAGENQTMEVAGLLRELRS